jgi:hypothetical protein
LLNKKTLTPFKRKYHIVSATFYFVDVGDNLAMADDVATPSNPLVAIVDKEKLEEVTFDGTPFDETSFDETPLNEVALEVNVSQRPREEEPSR